jgi:gas vesicle protein
MRRLINFLTGLFMGGLVGVTLGLLFAPSTGKEFQQRLLLNANELKGEIQLAAKTRREELQSRLENLRNI